MATNWATLIKNDNVLFRFDKNFSIDIMVSNGCNNFQDVVNLNEKKIGKFRMTEAQLTQYFRNDE